MSMRTFAAAIAAGAACHLTLATASAEAPRVGPPVVHDNVAIYLLKGKSAEGPVPLTLEEALSKGTIEVYETGNVRELKIENKGGEPVFVQLGDIVKGGRQDRVLTISLLLEPRSGVVPVGAYCVERGRWSARGKEDAHRFARSDALLPSAAAKVAIARPAGSPPPAAVGGPRPSPIETELNAVREREARARLQQLARPGLASQQAIAGLERGPSDRQGEVWRSVDVLQRQLSDNLATPVANESSRTSLQLSLENARLKAAQAAFIAALEPRALEDDDVIGVAVAIGGKVASADLYPSNGLFRKMWPKIVRATATEAIALEARSAAAGTGASPGTTAPPVPGTEAVEQFLAAANSARSAEHALSGLARLETREADKVLSVSATAAGGRLVHRSYMAK